MEPQEETMNMLAQERTFLAAERTFSAWIRTALAAMAGGLAILRLVIFKTDFHRIIGHIIGETLILWGCLLIILASLDYKRMRDSLTIAKHYKSSQIGVMIIIIPLVIISILLVWITLP
jgi:putative membrane protein